MYYIRIGMFSVKTRHGTPLRFITSSITIKQQWLTLDHWTCPLNNSPKESGGLKKNRLKKQNEILKKLFLKKIRSSQKFVVLILSISEVWKAESTLEPPNGFDNETPGLENQDLNH